LFAVVVGDFPRRCVAALLRHALDDATGAKHGQGLGAGVSAATQPAEKIMHVDAALSAVRELDRKLQAWPGGDAPVMI